MRHKTPARYLYCLLAVVILTFGFASANEGDKVIFVAGNPDFYPIEYYDSQEKCYKGVLPEILDDISEQSGYSFSYIHRKNADSKELAENLQVEIVSSYVIEGTHPIGKTHPDQNTHSDYVKAVTYTVDGKTYEIGFAFTEIADDALKNAVKSGVSAIDLTKINGMFVSGSIEKPGIDSIFWWLLAIICVLFALLVTMLALKIRSERRKHHEKATTDEETGIGNKLYFKTQFEESITDLSRRLYYVAFLMLDSDYIKSYYGVDTYSDIVKYTASVTASYTKHTDIVARLSDYSFAMAFQCMSTENARDIMTEIVTKINGFANDISKNNYKLVFTAVYNLLETDREFEPVILSLKQNCRKIFKSDTQVIVCEKKDMESDGNNAKLYESFINGLEKEEFKVYLQFIVDVKTGKIVSAEALSRWEHSVYGLLSPSKYISDIEHAGLVDELDFYMLEKVCALLESWKGTKLEALTVSCNFTRSTFSEVDTFNRVKEILDKYTFDRKHLAIEITEDVVEKNLETAKKNVLECKKLGIKIALDDMGSGYTSLVNLCDYPIDIVKLDRSILLNTSTKRGEELFCGMIAFCNSLNLKVICEGVETKEQYELVCRSNCDCIQGFYCSRVFPAHKTDDFLQKYASLNGYTEDDVIDTMVLSDGITD